MIEKTKKVIKLDTMDYDDFKSIIGLLTWVLQEQVATHTVAENHKDIQKIINKTVGKLSIAEQLSENYKDEDV